MKGKRVGFALCGSFCTINSAVLQMEQLANMGADIIPIMSPVVYNTDTRFGKAEDLKSRVEKITKNKIIYKIVEAEPIGPKSLLDILIIAPCTGNSLSKIANGITDTSVTMAAKAHLRNGKPVVIALATNDALSGSAQNIGRLLNTKGIYFVPFGQDDAIKKPTSMVCDYTKLTDTVREAVNGKQIQPMII